MTPTTLAILAVIAVGGYFLWLRLRKILQARTQAAEERQKERKRAGIVRQTDTMNRALSAFPDQYRETQTYCQSLINDETLARFIGDAAEHFIAARNYLRLNKFDDCFFSLHRAQAQLAKARNRFDELVCADQSDRMLQSQ